MKKYDMVIFYENHLTSRLESRSLDVLDTVQNSETLYCAVYALVGE